MSSYHISPCDKKPTILSHALLSYDKTTGFYRTHAKDRPEDLKTLDVRYQTSDLWFLPSDV